MGGSRTRAAPWLPPPWRASCRGGPPGRRNGPTLVVRREGPYGPLVVPRAKRPAPRWSLRCSASGIRGS
eukprot:13090662-Alexandrium_andersonii.AAC.1